MPQIFVSYSHADQTLAVRVADALRQAGHSVWWDDKLLAGHVFSDKIREAIDGADNVLVLWTRASVNSHWVLDEAGYARHKLLPLRMDDTPLPLGFGQLHTVDLQSWNGSGDTHEFRKVLEAIGAPAPEQRTVQTTGLRARLAPLAVRMAGASLVAAVAETVTHWSDGSNVLVDFAEFLAVAAGLSLPAALGAWLAARLVGISVPASAARLYLATVGWGILGGAVLVLVGFAGRAGSSGALDAFVLGTLLFADIVAGARLIWLLLVRRR